MICATLSSEAAEKSKSNMDPLEPRAPRDAMLAEKRLSNAKMILHLFSGNAKSDKARREIMRLDAVRGEFHHNGLAIFRFWAMRASHGKFSSCPDNGVFVGI